MSTSIRDLAETGHARTSRRCGIRTACAGARRRSGAVRVFRRRRYDQGLSGARDMQPVQNGNSGGMGTGKDCDSMREPRCGMEVWSCDRVPAGRLRGLSGIHAGVVPASEWTRSIPLPRQAGKLHIHFSTLPFQDTSRDCVWGIRGSGDSFDKREPV